MTLVKNLTVQDINTALLSIINQFHSSSSGSVSGFGQNLPIGIVLPYYSNDVPLNFLLCDGRDTTGTNDELETKYPILYRILGSNVLPDIRNKTIMGANPSTQNSPALGNTSDLGESQNAQLPTIIGEFDAQGYVDGGSGGNGAFKKKSSGKIDSGSSSSSNYPRVRSFNASFEGASSDHLTNNVYTESGEVRSANIRLNFIIKAR